ncbi:hypothetical protein N5P37_002811 [Trichoderma harzianum]|nr:hypothetical protein N5P37_002811 [Trichoderma harzianum]
MNDDIHKRRILLIGSGGREHALAWKLSQSASVEHVYVFPGNGGTVQTEKISNVVDESIVTERDYPALVTLALKLNIGLVVVGPDSAVVDGIEGCFRQSGIPCFAPSKEAAELEGSKTYAKDFMRKYEIPTAEYQNFDLSVAADLEQAKDYIQTVYHNAVIKASGLVAGKGVVLPSSAKEACEELDSFANGRFGASGLSVVVEEYLEGDEISVLTFSDGKSFKSFPPGQDHKRIFNGNTGPNTGGMGVYAPTTFVTDAMMSKIEETILRPTFDGLRAEGVRSGYACNVVISSAGYPGPYSTGKPLRLDPILSRDVHIFHAGTKLIGDVLHTAGGRVFSVAAYGDSLEDAVKGAYQGVEAISFQGMHFRTDIASRCMTKR